MLVASMNPCPCGYRGHPVKECVCTEYQVLRYLHRISGPLLDRIDIQLQIKPVEMDDLIPEQAESPNAESSGVLAESSAALAGSSGALAGSSGAPAESSAALAGSSGALAESSAAIRLRVEKAREIQRERFGGLEGVHTNAHMKTEQLSRYCALNGSCRTFLKQAALRMQFSARAHHRILRLARTIADLEGAVAIEIHHLAEAIQYR
jgi:magnesium chelatase family protein